MRHARTRFLVLTAPRTGSTWLVDLLNSHPQVAAYGELLLPEGQGPIPGGSQDIPYLRTYLLAGARPRTRARLLRRKLAFLNDIYAARPGIAAVGFKLTYRQSALNPWLLPYLSLRRGKVVHLIRTNLLDSLLSYESARARRVFHIQRGEPIAGVRVRLDTGRLLDRLEQHDFSVTRSRARLVTLRLPFIEVFYEELVGSRGAEKLAQVLDFIGARPDVSALDSPFVRVNAAPHAELIENYEEVRGALAGSRFEWMLD
jgi:sulfotransferase family protein